MKTGDIVMYRDERFGHHRFWQIHSVCIGAAGQEGLIELRNLTETPGRDTEGPAPQDDVGAGTDAAESRDLYARHSGRLMSATPINIAACLTIAAITFAGAAAWAG